MFRILKIGKFLTNKSSFLILGFSVSLLNIRRAMGFDIACSIIAEFLLDAPSILSLI